MSKADNSPFASSEGKKYLKSRLEILASPTATAAFWEFHKLLEQEGLSTKIDVRPGDPCKGGTSVYHGKKSMIYVNIFSTGDPRIDIVYYTGQNNQHQFPHLKPCYFRSNTDGGSGYLLTNETLATHLKYARLSASIMDSEADGKPIKEKPSAVSQPNKRQPLKRQPRERTPPPESVPPEVSNVKAPSSGCALQVLLLIGVSFAAGMALVRLFV